jgi:hypothetical protein
MVFSCCSCVSCTYKVAIILLNMSLRKIVYVYLIKHQLPNWLFMIIIQIWLCYGKYGTTRTFLIIHFRGKKDDKITFHSFFACAKLTFMMPWSWTFTVSLNHRFDLERLFMAETNIIVALLINSIRGWCEALYTNCKSASPVFARPDLVNLFEYLFISHLDYVFLIHSTINNKFIRLTAAKLRCPIQTKKVVVAIFTWLMECVAKVITYHFRIYLNQYL